MLTMIRKKQEQYGRLQDSIDGIGGSHADREIPLEILDDGIDLLRVAKAPEADIDLSVIQPEQNSTVLN